MEAETKGKENINEYEEAAMEWVMTVLMPFDGIEHNEQKPIRISTTGTQSSSKIQDQCVA